jgi:hypothetical protein
MPGGFQYIDGVGNVSVVNGMAHIDLVVVRPPAGEGKQPTVESVQHLVMALPQFVRLCAEMAGHLQRMEEKGLITRRPADGKDGAAGAGRPAAAPPGGQASPTDEQKRGGLFRRG